MLEERKQPPFVLIHDCHGSEDVYVSSDPKRFVGSNAVNEVEITDMNDYANVQCLRVLKGLGIESVYDNDVERFQAHLRDRLCQVFLFHCGMEELSDTTKLLIARPDILRVLMATPGAYGIDFEDQRMFSELPSLGCRERSQIFQARDDSDQDMLFAVKPFNQLTLAAALKQRMQIEG